MRWVEEFHQEIRHDHRQLIEARERRRGGPWAFEAAAEAVRRFYRDRIGGFATCGSVTAEERDGLLRLVEEIGRPSFPLDH